MRFRSLLPLISLVLAGCQGSGDDGDDSTSGGRSNGGTAGNTNSGGSHANLTYPLIYEGTARLHTTVQIEFDDQSSVECYGTGTWTATVTASQIEIKGTTSEFASFKDQTTVCLPYTGNFWFWEPGTHDGERFTIEFNYESTPIKFTGSFGEDELLGSYDASWTGVVAGFGRHTKAEDVSLALPRKIQ